MDRTKLEKNGRLELFDVTLLDWIQHFDPNAVRRGGDKFIPRAINYYPRYSHKPDAEDYEDFCRVKMMLHHPHLELNDLHVIDGETVSWQEACEHYQIFHAGLHEEDYLVDPEDLDALDQDAEEEFEDLDPETPDRKMILRRSLDVVPASTLLRPRTLKV